MKLTLKDLKQSVKTIDGLELDDTIETLMEKAKEMYGYPFGVKLIYCGNILDKQKNLSDYFKDDNTNSFIVCMPEKTKSNSTQAQPTQAQPTQAQPTQAQPTQAQPTQAQPIQAQPTQAQPIQTPDPANVTYNEEQIRAFLIVFTQFMRISPDVFHTYCTSTGSFQNFILSNTFIPTIMRPMLQTSSQVMNAIQTGQNINIPIPIVANTNFNNVTNINNTIQNETEIFDEYVEDVENVENVENVADLENVANNLFAQPSNPANSLHP
jgi:hypothetical protein